MCGFDRPDFLLEHNMMLTQCNEFWWQYYCKFMAKYTSLKNINKNLNGNLHMRLNRSIDKENARIPRKHCQYLWICRTIYSRQLENPGHTSEGGFVIERTSSQWNCGRNAVLYGGPLLPRFSVVICGCSVEISVLILRTNLELLHANSIALCSNVTLLGR